MHEPRDALGPPMSAAGYIHPEEAPPPESAFPRGMTCLNTTCLASVVPLRVLLRRFLFPALLALHSQRRTGAHPITRAHTHAPMHAGVRKESRYHTHIPSHPCTHFRIHSLLESFKGRVG